MIVRDAQDSLAPTLASIRSLADEIVVVDTGSADKTCEIARQYGAIVFERPWVDDFSAARNHARAHATGDWILWLDAGERLSAESAQGLRAFVDQRADVSTAYMLLVVVPAAASNISGEQIGRIRLVPNRPDLRFTGRVREQIRPSIEAAGLRIEGLPWQIARHARDNDPQIKLEKAQRDLHLLDLEIRDKGQTPVLLLALGEALLNLGDRDGAAAAFRKAQQTCSAPTAVMREAYYGLLTTMDGDLDQRDTQLAICLEALEKFPLDAQLLCAMGGYLQSQDRLDLAARAYSTAFEFGQVDPETWHVSDIREIAAVCLSLTLQLQNDDDRARQVLEEAQQGEPGSIRVRRMLIDLHVKHDRRKEALAEFDRLPVDLPHREALRSAIRGACLAAKQNWPPALAYLQTAYSAGCRDVLCLRWLAVTLVSTGEKESALPILRQWQAVEPRSTEVQKYLEALSSLSPSTIMEFPLLPSTDSRRLRVDAPASFAPVQPTTTGTSPKKTAHAALGAFSLEFPIAQSNP